VAVVPDGARHASPEAGGFGRLTTTIRTFVAILLPDEVRRALAASVDQLRPVSNDVAWIGPDNFHLTLKFLGAVEVDRLPALTETLADAAGGCPSFQLAIRGLGAFPTPARPRVLWAGIDAGAAPAAELAARVDEALAALGFKREARAFSPHVTLGRVRQPHAQPRLAEALTASVAFGRADVGHVSLMRSDLSSRGARYSELARAPLARMAAG
jgi:RNA 2',3'-cyclic 3'-phosphodiesterase